MPDKKARRVGSGEPLSDYEKELFEEAHLMLRQEFKTPGEAVKAFGGVPNLKKDSLRVKIWNKQNYTNTAARTLIDLMLRSRPSMGLHEHVLGVLGLSTKTSQTSLSKLLGQYVYFRPHPNRGLTKGAIHINQEDGRFYFRHARRLSVTDPTEANSRHVGHVVRIDGHLYMLGIKRGYIRLGICFAPADHNIHDRHISGIVLSLTEESPAVFASRFTLFHESHRLYSSLIKSESIEATITERMALKEYFGDEEWLQHADQAIINIPAGDG